MANRTASAASPALTRLVSELWWISVIQAVIAILFGIVATFWPSLTLSTLVVLLSAFVLAIGLTEIARGLMSIRARDTWWMTLIIGIFTTGVGIYLARHPHVTFATFILVVGITLIAWGVIDIIRAFLDRMRASHKILSYIGGLAAVIAGIITLVQPASAGVAFVWVLGLYAFIYGIMSLAIAIEFRREFEELAHEA